MHISPTPSRFLSRVNFSRDPHARCLYDPNTDPTDPPAPPVPPSPNPDPTPSDLKPDFKALAAAVVAEVLAAQSVKGDEKKALEVLAGRNARLEADRNNLQQEIGVLKTKIPDDAKTQADATELAAWRALAEKGIKKPDDVVAALTERDDFKGREEQRAKTEMRDKAAKAAGYDPEKFSALKGVDEWTYEVKTEAKDGKNVEVAYVVTKDDKGVESRKALDEVVAGSFPALADSIKATDASAQSTQGARHVQQGSGGTSGAGSKFEQIRQKNKQDAEAKKDSDAKPLEEIMHIGTNPGGLT